MIMKRRLNPHERYTRAKEIREKIIKFLRKEDVLGKDFYIKFRAARAASNIQKDVHVKTPRNNPPGRLGEQDKEEDMGFDISIIRRRDNFRLRFIINFNIHTTRFNTYYLKPHSLPNNETITQNECVPYFDTYFLFFNGIDENHITRYSIISGKEVWEKGKSFWGKLVWIKIGGWSTERNMIQIDLKRILKHIVWNSVFTERRGLGITKPSLTLLQAIKEVFKKERKMRK